MGDLTDSVRERFRDIFQKNHDVVVLQGDLNDEPDKAVQEASARDADVAIWGYRRVRNGAEVLDIHVDVVHPHFFLDSNRIEFGPNSPVQVPDPNHFSIEADVGNSLSFYALVALGARYVRRADLDRAISTFSNAIDTLKLHNNALPQQEDVIGPAARATVYVQRGTAFLRKKAFDEALNDHITATQTHRDMGSIGLLLGSAASLDLGYPVYALTFANKMIDLNPDNFAGHLLASHALYRAFLDQKPKDLRRQLELTGAASAHAATAILMAKSEDDAKIVKDMEQHAARCFTMTGAIFRALGNTEDSDLAFRQATMFAQLSGDPETAKGIADAIADAKRQIP